MRHRVLVVGRDVVLRGRLARVLKSAGYAVELAECAEHAKRTEPKDIALALVAPDGTGHDGEAMIETLRASFKHVLLISPAAGSQAGEQVLDAADEAGLLARVADVLRPAVAGDDEAARPVLRFAAFSFDPAGRSLTDATGAEVPLTRSEFGLLHAFVQRPGRVLSRDYLLQIMAGRDADAFDRSIDMLVVRLRRKIEVDPRHPGLIVTVPGSGYKFAGKVRETRREAAPAVLPAPTPPAAAGPERRPLTVLAAELLPAPGEALPSDPEELRGLVEAFRRFAAAVVTPYGGTLAESRGREVLAYFGYPVAQEFAAERAVHAALALAEHLAVGETALPPGLAVRVGVASGLVVADPAGEVQGETPSEAARLLAEADAGEVLVASSTRQLAENLFLYRDLEPLTFKGATAALSASRVVGPTSLISRSEARYTAAQTPLIGREEELASLLRAWRRAKAGEGQLVLLSGEPGIGKSRLLAALEDELRDEPHLSLRYFCSPLHRNSALYPIIARWGHEAGFTRDDQPGERLRKLAAILAPSALPAEDAALIAGLLSVPTGERYPQPELSPQHRKERIFQALHRRLAKLAESRPIVMLFEDAHWADPSSVELLDELVDRITDLPILLVISFRPEFIAPWVGRAGVTPITLSRLSRRHSAALAAQVTAENILTRDLLDRILTYTDGVPLFIEKLSKAVLEVAEGKPEPAFPSVLPVAIQATLMARLDRIPAAKRVAQIGAVIGREFSHALVAAVARLPDAELAEGLDQLVSSGLAARRGTPPDALYTFRQVLVQDLAYGTLLKDRRRELHRRTAEALQDLLPEQAESEPEIAAHHFMKADIVESAVRWWSKAGELALRRSAFLEAISYTEMAIRLADKLDNIPVHCLARMRLHILLGNTLRSARGFAVPETLSEFQRAVELGAGIEPIHERGPAQFGLWSGALVAGEPTAMLSAADAFLRDVGRAPDALALHIADRIHGTTCWFRGDLTKAGLHLRRALAFSCDERDHERSYRFGDHDHSVASALVLMLVEWALGHLGAATGLAEQGIRQAFHAKHVPTAALAHAQTALFEMIRRDLRGVAAHAQALRDVVEEHGVASWQGICAFVSGWVEWHEGNRQQGSERMREGMATMRAQRQQIFMPVMATAMARTAGEDGSAESGLAILDDQITVIGETGQRWFLSEVHRVRGDMLLKARPHDRAEAEASFARAINVARQQSAKMFELRAATSLARLWAGCGRPMDAQRLLAPIAGSFAHEPDWPDLKEARALSLHLHMTATGPDTGKRPLFDRH